MADTKISGLSALTAPAGGDLLVVVDISDTTMAGTGTDKQVTFTTLWSTIAVPSKTAVVMIGSYGTISETGGGLAYITGNSVKSDPSTDNQIVKTSGDNGQFIRMRYDQGISFHSNLTGAIGTTYADSDNQVCRVYGTVLRFGLAGADSLGIAKSATDVLEVNNGTVGTYRDILTRSVLIDGAPSTAGAGQIAIGADTRTTIGANGGASALTANPVGYIDINVAGSSYQIPYYSRGA